MRARARLPLAAPLLLLLLLLLLGVTDGAPPSPSVPGGVLLLRSACPARDPAAFDAGRLRALAAASGRPALLARYRLLGYRESCGAGWSAAVARATLGALAAGGGLVSDAWPGAPACLLVRAARHPPPAACAAPPARAAVLLRVLRRMRVRRVLLPPARGVCGASLRAAAHLLRAAGTAVRRAPLSAPELAREPHAVVACWSRAAPPAPPPASALLLVRVADDDDDDDDAMIDDIALDVGTLPYARNVDYVESISLDSSVSAKNTSFINLTHNYINKNYGLSASLTKNISSDVVDEYDNAFDAYEEGTRHGILWSGEPPRLVLDDPRPRRSAGSVVEDARRGLFDGIERDAHVRRTGVATATHKFYLYKMRDDVDATRWLQVAIFETTAERRIDDDDGDWAVMVTTANRTDVWWRWANGGGAGPGADRTVLVGALWAAAALLLLLLLAGAARAAAWKRRGRRRRADVVLAAADFTFPADEARRVPDGMETMLSCWLQQLHEFGGPGLERPDLLLPAPPATRVPPSAPSSTASASRLALDKRTRYKGDAVHLKALPLSPAVSELQLRRRATDVLLVLHSLRHENLNPFIGCLCATRPALVWDHCGRGSLEDVLMADDIKLDWTFRLSLLTDLVKGLRYLHASPLRVHGRLSSRNCAVDARWVLRLTDHGLPDFLRAQGLALPPRAARELLWTAPELLRGGEGARGSQAGDVFSFAIIMQEVIVRGEPYCMLALSPDEIVDKLCRPPPLIRPSVSMGAAPPEAVSVMRQCWAEPPDLRPTTDALLDIFRLLHRGRKINIVDSMFEMLEKYSNNLEELIRERTEQLDMEKRKTEQLLNRMLPRSVAERLLLGLSVEPEEFEEVSIYFSDIVGFTALAARSSPVQVVALLNDLYTTFDAAIERYRVYKVETIGDAYMVVGGLPVRARDHAESVATMALHLLHEAGRFRVRHLPATPLHLRIGLHSGPCCAGVVGLTMPRYCLFGDTVNTASRMESTGAAWRIQVSAATAARLEVAGGYRLRSRGLTQIKGKGAMHTYWLLGKDGFDKPLPTPPPLQSENTLVELEAEDEEGAAGAASTGNGADGGAPPAMLDTTDDPAEPALILHDKFAWQRSGAVSADSSPPGAGATRYSRYRCLGGGRVLRRQWSLERGDELAAARAMPRAPTPPPSAAAAPPAAPRHARYRMRPEPPAPPSAASFD